MFWVVLFVIGWWWWSWWCWRCAGGEGGNRASDNQNTGDTKWICSVIWSVFHTLIHVTFCISPIPSSSCTFNLMYKVWDLQRRLLQKSVSLGLCSCCHFFLCLGNWKSCIFSTWQTKVFTFAPVLGTVALFQWLCRLGFGISIAETHRRNFNRVSFTEGTAGIQCSAQRNCQSTPTLSGCVPPLRIIRLQKHFVTFLDVRIHTMYVTHHVHNSCVFLFMYLVQKCLNDFLIQKCDEPPEVPIETCLPIIADGCRSTQPLHNVKEVYTETPPVENKNSHKFTIQEVYKVLRLDLPSKTYQTRWYWRLGLLGSKFATQTSKWQMHSMQTFCVTCDWCSHACSDEVGVFLGEINVKSNARRNWSGHAFEPPVFTKIQHV